MFFVDAAHFVLAPFWGLLGGFARLFIPAPAGRQRFKVWGALKAITPEVVTVTHTTDINAERGCEWLRRLATLQRAVPIPFVRDTARYQKCQGGQRVADTLPIELRSRPPYSPPLNLLERVWKFVKKKCLYATY